MLSKGGGPGAVRLAPARCSATPPSPFVADFVGADRGLQRLGVTCVELADLTRVPIVAPAMQLGEAFRMMRASDSRFAIVLDGGERPSGWVPGQGAERNGRAEAHGPATRANGAARAAPRTPLPSTCARSTRPCPSAPRSETPSRLMLQHDDGFVTVVDEERYVGVLTPDDVHAAMRRSIGGEPVEV